MNHFDVGIIGMGPVGCTAALFLADAGLRVIAIERDTEVYKLPRAVNLDGEIIRAFQRINRATIVDGLMQTLREGDRAGFANSRREWLFGQNFVDFGANGWQPTNMFDQPEFEAYLRNEVLAHPDVTVFEGYEATSVLNESNKVVIDFQTLNQDDVHKVTATYAIGCDGASSQIRRSLNIGWQNLGYDCDWLVVDVITKEGHTLTNDTLQVCDPDRIHTYVCTKDPYRRWEFKFNPGETAEELLQEEKISSLLDAWTPRDTYEIRRAAVYQFHAATADQWRVGHIFIAGDAAHQTPPFLGQGMNAGMRDVVNLSWKLPLVIQKKADDRLLDTYESEREAHAQDLVDWAVNVGKLMDHTAEVERAVQQGVLPPEAPEQMKSSGYGQGRAQPPIRDGAVLIDQVNDAGSTGYLFNQPDVLAEGQNYKLDDLLKPGFALVHKFDELSLDETSKRIIDHLNISIVDLGNLTPIRGRFDQLFKEHDAALVRPDRIVFGHTTDQVSVDDLLLAASSKLALTNY